MFWETSFIWYENELLKDTVNFKENEMTYQKKKKCTKQAKYESWTDI